MSNGTEMKAEMAQKRTMIIKFQKDSINAGTWQCCLSCDHWVANETCDKFKARPPAMVIATGCPEFVDNIPF